MPAPAACLFDLDGLLLDTEPLHGQAWGQAAAHFGTVLSPSQLLMLRGRRRRDCAEQVVRWIEAPISCEQLLEVQQPIAKQLLPSAAANPGAEALIQWCITQAVPMALVTSSSRESVTYKTAAHPWIDPIKTRVLGDDPDLTAGKPAPDPFVLAAQRLGVDPKIAGPLKTRLLGVTPPSPQVARCGSSTPTAKTSTSNNCPPADAGRRSTASMRCWSGNNQGIND